MSQLVPITGLPAASTLADVDLLAAYVFVSGSTFDVKKITVANLKTLFGLKQLPAWTYMAGDSAPTAGHFQANTSTLSATSQLWFSLTGPGSVNFSNLWGETATQSILFLTDSAGKTSAFNITTITVNANDVLLDVAPVAADSTAWSGVYAVSFGISIYTVLGIDSGWTAPQGVGSKAQLASYTAPDFTGSDTIDASNVTDLAAKVQALNAWAQAIQTALANNVRPNA